MPVVGIGVDVVDIARFARTLQRTPSVAERLFAEDERTLAPARLAARFAAKEAVVKALGGPGGLSWRDVAVDNDERGRPLLRVSGRTAAAADRLGVTSWHVSLSHDAATAVAVVVAER